MKTILIIVKYDVQHSFHLRKFSIYHRHVGKYFNLKYQKYERCIKNIMIYK